MTVTRSTTSTDEPAIMSIHFAPKDSPQTSDSLTSSSAPTNSSTSQADAASTDRVETINMTHTTNSEILDAVVRLTKAYPVEPTVEERAELRSLEEQSVRSKRDSKRSLEVREARRREKELLEQARGDIAAQAA